MPSSRRHAGRDRLGDAWIVSIAGAGRVHRHDRIRSRRRAGSRRGQADRGSTPSRVDASGPARRPETRTDGISPTAVRRALDSGRCCVFLCASADASRREPAGHQVARRSRSMIASRRSSAGGVRHRRRLMPRPSPTSLSARGMCPAGAVAACNGRGGEACYGARHGGHGVGPRL